MLAYESTMAKRLGRVQQRVLDLLTERRSWSESGSGWMWGTMSYTKRIMDSLVRSGAASVVRRGEGVLGTCTYYPTDGKAAGGLT